MTERPTSIADSYAAAVNTPLPQGDRDLLEPPQPGFLSGLSTPAQRDSYAASNPDNNAFLPREDSSAQLRGEKGGEVATRSPAKKSRRLLWLGVAALLLVVVVLVVVLPVYFRVVRPRQNSDNSTAAPSTPEDETPGDETPGAEEPNTPERVVTGGDGSIVTTEDGTEFTYTNPFGGYWYHDPNDPFNNGARANSWSPPLNQTWRWGRDRVYGVNLGGWFVLEPFISPALFQKYPGSRDEWSLSINMAADTSPGGGLRQLEEHYNTFITEQDFAEIAGAGLNWIRLPIPFWAVEKYPDEPYLDRVCWQYILRAIEWARKYGLRVNIDLHTIPGSQSGYNHSGKGGSINFLNGVMGYANAQRAMEYIRVLAQFFAQPQYNEIVGMFGIMNEPVLGVIGRGTLSSFYLEIHDMIRGITGIGEGNGFYISYHDGFGGMSSWSDFLVGADRIALDTHPYFAFDGTPATEPIATGTGEGAGGIWPQRACERWASSINGSRTGFGVTTAGEFSNGFNDCALFLTGVGGSQNYGGDCSFWEDSSQWDEETKAGLHRFTLASMDALQDFFFWTWKIGNSTAGRVQAPLWSYQLGLREGWMPTDPRTSIGVCASYGVSGSIFDGEFQPWQTGGVGAGTIAAASTAAFPWPPPSIANAGPATLLPSYTPTGVVQTLPPITFAVTPTPSVDVGDGWFNDADTAGAPTPIAGCTYPDQWDAVDAAIPPLCTGDGAAASEITPAPI
ncbi:hypothetical protein AX16_009962 [Volvariella volvacea WC 439]|nr:hypothetical protein AX16_009962 [Volvariella volvacea WC 439]